MIYNTDWMTTEEKALFDQLTPDRQKLVVARSMELLRCATSLKEWVPHDIISKGGVKNVPTPIL